MRQLILFILLISSSVYSQNYSFKPALLKYNGGGDWYANLETSLKNLALFCNQNLGTNIDPEQAIIEVNDRAIFNYPFVHVTGHGNITFNEEEKQNLRKYLLSGGFLHIDDNYGFDPYIRREMKTVFPELDFVELPKNHVIYNLTYKFPNGLPKIHEHDDGQAKGFGLFYNGRMICFYTHESDLGDGWESPDVHNDSQEKRLQALKMGANIIEYVLMAGDYVE